MIQLETIKRLVAFDSAMPLGALSSCAIRSNRGSITSKRWRRLPLSRPRSGSCS